MENFDEFTMNENSDQAVVVSDNTLAISVVEATEPERLTLYRSAMQETARKITSSVSKEDLVEMFKDIPSFKKKYNLISYYYEVLSKHIHDQMNSRIEEHIVSAELGEKFTLLEELIKSYSAVYGTTAWRPSRDIESNLRSYIMQEKMIYRDQLKDLVNAREDAVNRLKFDVATSRNQMNKIDERLEVANDKYLSIAKKVEAACQK